MLLDAFLNRIGITERINNPTRPTEISRTLLNLIFALDNGMINNSGVFCGHVCEYDLISCFISNSERINMYTICIYFLYTECLLNSV